MSTTQYKESIRQLTKSTNSRGSSEISDFQWTFCLEKVDFPCMKNGQELFWMLSKALQTCSLKSGDGFTYPQSHHMTSMSQYKEPIRQLTKSMNSRGSSEIVNVFFYDNCIINGKYTTFLVFSILQKFSTGYPILKLDVPLKICTKDFNLNMKILSNTPHWYRLGVHSSHFFPRFERMDFLLVAFLFDGGFGFAFRFFCFTLTQVSWFR